MALQARQVIGSFEKRAPGPRLELDFQLNSLVKMVEVLTLDTDGLLLLVIVSIASSLLLFSCKKSE